jgi:hypothetical protein
MIEAMKDTAEKYMGQEDAPQFFYGFPDVSCRYQNDLSCQLA